MRARVSQHTYRSTCSRARISEHAYHGTHVTARVSERAYHGTHTTARPSQHTHRGTRITARISLHACPRTISRHYTTARCRGTISGHGVATRYHSTMSQRDVRARHHSTIPRLFEAQVAMPSLLDTVGAFLSDSFEQCPRATGLCGVCARKPAFLSTPQSPRSSCRTGVLRCQELRLVPLAGTITSFVRSRVQLSLPLLRLS